MCVWGGGAGRGKGEEQGGVVEGERGEHGGGGLISLG